MLIKTLCLLFIASYTNANYIPRPVYNRPYMPPSPPRPNIYPVYPPPQLRPYHPPSYPIHPPTTQVYKPSVDVILKGEKCVDRIPHPQNPHQYISCLPDGDYVIMDCPDGLVFNKYLDRCDYNANEISPCAAKPCSHGGKCVELPEHNYKCECQQGFSGENCEVTPDICVMNPCGPNGECHMMPFNSPIPFYCTCFNERFYGLGCNRNSVPNPCHLSESSESYFKVKLDPSLFIHCDGTNLYMKFCPRPLVFSTRDNICDWESHEQNHEPSNQHQNFEHTTKAY